MKSKRLTLRLYRDKKNEFRWTLIAPNGKKLSDSGEGYKRKRFMERGAFISLTGCGDLCWESFYDHRPDIAVLDEATKTK